MTIIKKITDIIKSDGVAILPTDTLYGLHASAFSKKGVERIYKLKNRKRDKPFIILINSWEDLEKLSIDISDNIKQKLDKWWPGSLSVILPCNDDSLKYLHRDTNSLAIRWPDYSVINNIIKQTGPLVSTTVNIEGGEPAKTIKEAREIFGNDVAAYLDDGELAGTHSTLIKVNGDKIEVLREGVVKV